MKKIDLPAQRERKERMDKQKEQEANRFALMLLIPTKFLKEDLAKYPNGVDEDDIVKLAKKYRVSPVNMALRINL